MTATVPAGIDAPKVTEYLTSHIEGVEPPLTFELIAGGRSNLTFRVTDANGRGLVLRRPPLSHVLATAHDMGREHRIIAALGPTPVPVPDALAYCDDPSVNGAPFYVMNRVDGSVIRTADQAEKRLPGEDVRRRVSEHLMDVLVDLHAVDIDAVGLGELARRDGYIERQLKRWYGQFQQSQDQEKEAGVYRPADVIHEVHDLLAERIPTEHPATIAHGDYKLDNTIVGPDGDVRAVLDWELCTLGEPLADLGTCLVYWADRNDPQSRGGATTLPGFFTREELAARYAKGSGRDISDLPYYVAFAHWRLACITEGVFARYAAGAMGDQQAAGVEMMARGAVHRGEMAKAALLQGL